MGGVSTDAPRCTPHRCQIRDRLRGWSEDGHPTVSLHRQLLVPSFPRFPNFPWNISPHASCLGAHALTDTESGQSGCGTISMMSLFGFHTRLFPDSMGHVPVVMMCSLEVSSWSKLEVSSQASFRYSSMSANRAIQLSETEV